MARRGKPPTTDIRERRGIQSLELGARILDALASGDGPMTLKALSDSAAMSASQAHRYLSGFVKTGQVVQDPATGRYDFGPSILAYGIAALARFDVVDETYRAVGELAEETGATALVSFWGEHGPTIVRWRRSRRPLVTSLNLGSVLPLLTSATGRVFYAFLPESVTDHLLTSELRAQGSARNRVRAGEVVTRTAAKRLRAEVLRQGHASVDSLVIPGLCAVAAPVLDLQGEASVVVTLISNDSGLIAPDSPAYARLHAVCSRLSMKWPLPKQGG